MALSRVTSSKSRSFARTIKLASTKEIFGDFRNNLEEPSISAGLSWSKSTSLFFMSSSMAFFAIFTPSLILRMVATSERT